jgi:hypothetical protein
MNQNVKAMTKVRDSYGITVLSAQRPDEKARTFEFCELPSNRDPIVPKSGVFSGG